MRSGTMVALRVGELARRTGVSVRTLHYYDAIGLLAPSRHSEAGYRLYTARDVARLRQIKSLRQLGFSLDEIRDCLDQPDFSPQRVIALHLTRLREQIALQQELCGRLAALAARLDETEESSVDTLMQTIEVMSMVESYYTPEQLAALKRRGAEVGAARIRQVEADWPELMAQVRAELDNGTDPADERVQALARRWMGLIQEFTGGNVGIEQSLRQMWQQEPVIHGVETAPLRDLGEYIGKALAVSKQSQ